MTDFTSKVFLTLTVFFSLTISTLLGQTATKYDTITFLDKKKVTQQTELDFAKTDMRGIESKTGIIYYVASDNQTLTSYEKGKIKWEVNIIKTCGKPQVGQPAIRYIKLEKDKIFITFGKHSYAIVDIETGKTTNLGAD